MLTDNHENLQLGGIRKNHNKKLKIVTAIKYILSLRGQSGLAVGGEDKKRSLFKMTL